MKRIISFLLCTVILFSLFSCTKENTDRTTLTATGSEIEEESLRPDFDYEPVGVEITANPFPNLDLTGMTEVQKALAVTAESFFIRGSRIQYEDTRFLNSTKLPYYRWAVQQRSLEEYTSQNLGFLQCAAFCYEVYRNALDLDLIYEDTVCYYTSRYDTNANHVLRETPAASGFSSLSADALEAKKQEFLSALQPGDIIVYRTKNNGHAMLYVGGGTVIHSSGSVYNWEEKREVFENQGTVRKDAVTFLFDKNTTRYIFNKQSYCIVRPIADFGITEIPEKSKSRIDQMRGVLAEKLSSHTASQTASPEEEITYTFSLHNTTSEKKTLTVTDTLPAFTEFVKGDLSLEGNALSANVTLPAGEKKQLSYTVRIQKDAPKGTLIESESFVSAIPTNCSPVTVANTLTRSQQDAILKASEDCSATKVFGLELANIIYEKALGKKALEETDSAAILADLYHFYSDILENKTSDTDPNWPSHWRTLNSDSKYLPYVAPDLYGGRYVAVNSSSTAISDLEWFQNKRARYVSADRLMIGDIVITSVSSDLKANAYLYLGDCLLSLKENSPISPEPLLSRLVSDRYFVVLRPSLGMN